MTAKRAEAAALMFGIEICPVKDGKRDLCYDREIKNVGGSEES